MTMVWSPDYAPVDGDFDSVSLLLLGEGTNGSTTILDSSSNSLSVTAVDNAQIINTVATPFSPTVPSDGVLAFDGNGDYIYSYSNSDFQFGLGDFTIELWARFTTISDQLLFDTIQVGGSGSRVNGFAWLLQSTGNLNIYSSNSFLGATATTLTANKWYHLVICKNNSVCNYFINGVKDATQVAFATNVTDDNFLCGRIGNSATYFLNGYISNLRITKGVARYTENFDVPTAPFPIYSPTTRAQA